MKTITSCERDDLPAVCEIINESALAYKGVIPADQWNEPYMPFSELESEISNGVRFFGCRCDGRVLGVMGIQDVKEVTLIRHAYVRPEFRGQGIGRALLKFLVKQTSRPILIGTWKAAGWAVRFYENNGFTPVGETEKSRLLTSYWTVSERQIEESVVLADARWRDRAGQQNGEGATAPMPKSSARPVTTHEFESLFEQLKNWGQWGPDDARGTLNYITPACIANAAKLVRSGRSVSLAIPINKVAGPDNPRPPVHYMAHNFDIHWPLGEPQFACDYLGSEIHGDCHTHVDALCHVSYKGRLFNGKSTSVVTTHGPTAMDITAFAHGIVGRGVLLDLPRLHGVKWLEPGHAVTCEELETAEKVQGVRLQPGDIFVFRTGHHRRRLDLGPWNPGPDGEGRAGLHVTALTLLHERQVAAFFPDGDGETVPSNVEKIPYPIHAIQLPAMGMVCADSLQFEELVSVCEQEKRWEFFVTAAPLRLPRGTGSLFNPIAIF